MRQLRLALILATLISFSACSKSSDAMRRADDVIVEAGGEQIRGVALASDVVVFRGIPFAAAPLGSLRWKPPQPHAPREGIQDATAFGPACPQDQGNHEWYRDVAKSFGADQNVIPPLTNISEDCLYLNIWTASVGAQNPKPVMVWIHGGSNVNGYSYEPNYLGHELARRGLVLVSINYRLGALGFMAHPALSAEDPNSVSGFYGLADQVAALQWIKSNIASFGGDPGNVTVFGESAGGGDISALMRMPSATGLFHKAIIQSGALGPYDSIDYSKALEAGKRLISSMNVTTMVEMRELEWKRLIQQRSAVLEEYYFGPITDGHYLPGDNIVSPTHLLIGANKDEWLMYLPEDASSSLAGALGDYAGSNSNKVEQYLDRKFDTVEQRANHLISAAEFLCPALDLAKDVSASGYSAFAYYFMRVRPNGDDLLAYHGAEIPYVFDTADDWLPADNIDQRLTEIMVQYWTEFARNGDPNNDGLPHWPRYKGDDRNIMELGDQVRVATEKPDTICALLGYSK